MERIRQDCLDTAGASGMTRMTASFRRREVDRESARIRRFAAKGRTARDKTRHDSWSREHRAAAGGCRAFGATGLDPLFAVADLPCRSGGRRPSRPQEERTVIAMILAIIHIVGLNSPTDVMRVMEVIATLAISGAALYATLSIREITEKANDREEREKIRRLKTERVVKLVALTNVIARHRELFQNTKYPIYSKDKNFEVVIRLNVGDSDDDRTKEKSNINFLMVRHKEQNRGANIMSFMYRGDQEVESSSIDFERVPGSYSDSEKWDLFIDALSSAININISGLSVRDMMIEYHNRDSDQISEITGKVGKVRGFYSMKSQYDTRLKNAIVGINLIEVNRVIKKITHIDARDMQGKTFLHYAVYDAYNRLWNTPQYEGESGEDKRNFDYASSMKNSLRVIIATLIYNKADINSQDNQGVPVIYLAAAAGNWGAVDKLISHGVEVNVKSESGDMNALHIASFLGHKKVVEMLLKGGADANIQGSKGRTALHFAIEGLENEDLEAVVKLLIGGGADRSIEDQSGASPSPDYSPG